MKGPHRHRTHAGWIDEVRSRPELPRKVKRVLRAVVETATYVNKSQNTYGVTQAHLASRMEIDVRNVKRALNDAVDARWLLICTPGHKGRQQVYHRAVPWDEPRHWTHRPCPACGGRFTVRRRLLEQSVSDDLGFVDPETGEIWGRNMGAIRPPVRPPYVSDYQRLVSLASQAGDWAGWQVVAAIERTRPRVAA